MNRPLRDTLLIAAALLVGTVTACHREHASVEELYTTRTLGLGYLQRNQLAEAESSFRKLTDLAPADPLGWEYLGLTYLQGNRLADAEKPLRRAHELDSTSTEISLALAKVYALSGKQQDARTILERLHSDSSSDPHVLYALARLDAAGNDSASRARYASRLREVLAVAPANLVARLELLDLFVQQGATDSAVRQLEEVRRIPPAPPKEAGIYLDSSIQLLRAAKLPEAHAAIDRFVGLMQVTVPYQKSREEVRWADQPIAGQPVLTFLPKSFVSLHGVRERATIDSVRFVDVSGESGLPGGGALPAALATGDVDGDGVDDIFLANGSGAHLYRVQAGFVRDVSARSGISLPQGATFATFADVDDDGWLDLFAIGGDGRAHLFHNKGDGTFEDATAKSGIDAKGATKAVFVDVDHDGDLDLVLVGGGQRAVWRNNLDGTFTDVTAAYGLGGGAASDVAFGDFDGDGRTDLAFAGPQGVALYHNGGAQRFSDVTAASGLSAPSAADVVAAADYDNDGFLDLLVAGPGGAVLWRNRGDGTFAREDRSAATLRAAGGVTAVQFLDYDNDGWLDVIAGGPGGARLLRNDGSGRFVDRTSILPAALRTVGATSLAVTDVDGDGDEDILVLDGKGAPHLLRNDGGNANLAVDVELKALRTGSGKNNAFGIGSRLELRAGDIYQTRVATSRVTHFGLGPHLKADVLRVEWPNGVPQVVYLPGSDRDVVESELLKGSCAFAYAWDGTHFRFVTDAMWRSALGMPLGLMGSASAFAPAGASQEYVRIPGDALKPRDGSYVLQLTEELWETAYADEVKLVAVDHPDSVDVFVDERFVPPGPVQLKLYEIAHRELPRSAVDERGADVLPALRASDDVYVSNLVPTRYQGVVEPHDLVLDLGPNVGDANSYLFLRGWIYPTDASINVALAQQSAIAATPPSLEVRDARGQWRVVSPSLGFPSGKSKTMVIPLAGIFPTADHHVRLRTTMQIYWDEAFTAHTLGSDQATLTTLAPQSADLHARGFSRMYRKGGRYGPYWFDYDNVTRQSPWRPIAGAFTRFGDVTPLLGKGDDMYVVMAPGDETTIRFDASSATAVPKGWRRDFLLYTDGWIKDSDLNTAFGTTVEPLPFHAIRSYPYAPGDAYPTDSAHVRYLHEYETRVLGRRAEGSLRK